MKRDFTWSPHLILPYVTELCTGDELYDEISFKLDEGEYFNERESSQPNHTTSDKSGTVLKSIALP